MTIHVKMLVALYLVSCLIFIGTFKNLSKHDFKRSSGWWFPASIAFGLGSLFYFFYLVSAHKL